MTELPATPARPRAKAGSGTSSKGVRQHQQTQAQVQAQRRGAWVLHVSRGAVLNPYGFNGREEFELRLDPEAIPYADASRRVLYAHHTKGLLQAGRRQLLVQYLRQELPYVAALCRGLPYVSSGGGGGMQAAAGGRGLATPAAAVVAATAGAAAAVAGVGSAAAADDTAAGAAPAAVQDMPTRRQLLDAGRSDLAALVAEAGGFAEVALRLGLRCRRRPRGYWSGPGSLTRLDTEVAAFVAGAWVQLPHPDDPSRVYYYNQVSGRSTWRLPRPLRQPAPAVPAEIYPHGAAGASAVSISSSGDSRSSKGGGGSAVTARGRGWPQLEAAADRVMPSSSMVLQAGRYALHNAVQLHGGYAAVARQLGRRVTWALSTNLYDSPAALRAKLADVARELQLPAGTMPTQRELRQLGHRGLIAAIVRRGGFRATAAQLGLAARRPAAPSGAAAATAAQQQQQGQGRGRRRRGTWDDARALAAELAAFAAELQFLGAPKPSQPSRPSQLPQTLSTQGQQQQQQQPSRPPSPQAQQGEQQPPPLPMPTQRQLRAAGRYDLLYGMVRHRAVLADVAAAAGLVAGGGGAAAGGGAMRGRRGTNRGALRWQRVAAAIQDGCRTPSAVRQHLELRQGVTVSRQHLTLYMRARAEEGALVRTARGVYEVPRSPVE